MTERQPDVADDEPETPDPIDLLDDLPPSEQTATSVTGGGEPSGTGQDEGPSG